MIDEPDEDFRSPVDIYIDSEPDERGNLMIAITFLGQRKVAIHFNTN